MKSDEKIDRVKKPRSFTLRIKCLPRCTFTSTTAVRVTAATTTATLSRTHARQTPSNKNARGRFSPCPAVVSRKSPPGRTSRKDRSETVYTVTDPKYMPYIRVPVYTYMYRYTCCYYYYYFKDKGERLLRLWRRFLKALP